MQHYFLPKRDEMGLESEKKILVPNFVHTRPGQENSKENSKKIQKIKKVNSGIISIQNGLKEAEKEEKKNFVPNSVPTQPWLKNSVKKSINQKIKNIILALFLSKLG